MSSKRPKRRKEAKNKEVKKDLTPQFVTCDLADSKYSGIIREDLLGAQYLEGSASTYIWSKGTRYEGPFVASQIEGRGTFVWPDGSRYEGELMGGRRNGEGCYQSHDGQTRYEGQWLDGKRHGQGKLTYSAGPSFYDGGWQAGLKHGYGKQLWPSGNCYEGEWKLGKMDGLGTMIWKNGSSAEIYSGEWVENCPHGDGSHTWLTLDRPDTTTESWINQPSPPPSAGAPHVSATQLLPQEQRRHEAQMHATQQLNNRYTGQWVWGRRQGLGTFYYANGAYYHGEWKANVKEGHGRHTFDDGKVYDGKFEADHMVDYSKPEVAKDENPVCGCTDIADLEMILRPADRMGLVKAPLMGLAEPAKMLRGIFNVLLRHLGDLRENYARARAVQPLLGEDPHVITLVQFWSLARDAGILTPNSLIARFDRAVFAGPRHQAELAPLDEKELEPLTPRRSSRPSTQPRPGSKDSIMTRHRSSSASGSRSEETRVEEPMPQEDVEADLEALLEELCQSPSSVSSLGAKYLRRSVQDGNLAHVHAPARPLLFRHFLESFVRMAPMRFPHDPGLEMQVQRLFKEQVIPCLKNNFSQKSEGGGLISMLQNFRRPTSSVFGLFTQPEVRDVLLELEPQLWKLYVELSGDAFAQQALTSIPGGGIFLGAGGLGANSSNKVLPLGLRFRGRRPSCSQEAAMAVPAQRRAWGSALRELHVLARLNVGLRIKDVLRFLQMLGLLQNTQILAEQERPLVEVLAGSEGDPVNNLLGPLGGGLAQEEPVEEENISEDDEGSGGSAVPEEDEDRKQLPGLSISFMPKGSLLGGPPGGKEEGKPKRKGDKEKKDKKEEKEVRTPAEDLACINLTIDAIEVLRILAQVLAPSSLEQLQWEHDTTEVELDQRVTLLEFAESEIVFAEFIRFLFLMAELTTRRDYKFCRSVSLAARLELFVRLVISHCQLGETYAPPAPAGEKVERVKVTLPEAAQVTEETPPEIPGIAEEEPDVPPVEVAPPPETWLGHDYEDTRGQRRWLAGYDEEVADW